MYPNRCYCVANEKFVNAIRTIEICCCCYIFFMSFPTQCLLRTRSNTIKSCEEVFHLSSLAKASFPNKFIVISIIFTISIRNDIQSLSCNLNFVVLHDTCFSMSAYELKVSSSSCRRTQPPKLWLAWGASIANVKLLMLEVHDVPPKCYEFFLTYGTMNLAQKILELIYRWLSAEIRKNYSHFRLLWVPPVEILENISFGIFIYNQSKL